MQGSPYSERFADRVNAWEKRLAELDTGITGLQQVQRRWVYLEPIFGGGAITREASRFCRIDVDFRNLLTGIEADNRVISLINGRRENELRDMLNNLLDQLTRCQRALNEYLEEKRSLFPRFYFLGDDDLLELLGHSASPTVIQMHLRKLFQAIHCVQLCNKGNEIRISAFCSQEGEVVRLNNTVMVDSEVEKWLRQLETEMRSTLSTALSESLSSRLDPSEYPGQILALREAISFSAKVEKAITAGKLPHLHRELQASSLQINAFKNFSVFQSTLNSYSEASMRLHMTKQDAASDEGSQNLSRVSAAKLFTLILDTGHRISVVDHLVKQTTTSVCDWPWQKQLRFYFDAGSAAVPKIRMADAEFSYTFEYQGNAPRLVHTPLTDRCYLTLTQAMQMGMGGNPYGPAGTGKTESVKQLGGLLGRQVLVFNCDEGIDVQSMGRIFVGLVKCGAWGCFDEFNRLEEAVMSAVSMQIQVIQSGLRSGASSVELLGSCVDLDPTTAIFITMNPAGKAYGGRQKLPDNLKQLFRPVAMTKPDNELIAETILFSLGFSHGRELGKKLVAIFALARQLLSVQRHYDWGLRELKSVLRNAGILLRQARQQGNLGNPESRVTMQGSSPQCVDPLNLETQLLLQSVRACSLAKLTYADATRFDALLRDVFPDRSHHERVLEDDLTTKLTAAIHEVLRENHLEVIERQVSKALEVNSLLTQRMGVVIVGPSGCGKSTVLHVLWRALQKVGITIKRYIMNPKALPRTHLLGHTDPDTREWTDGVLTRSARNVAQDLSDTKSWIICDGDVDPEWVESLNSVLDDNHLLTLPSGERIQFRENVNFIFETHELASASPATISRMAVLFISDEMLDPTSLVKAWLRKQPEEDKQFLSDMIDAAFYTCLSWVKKRNEYVLETSYTGTILNGLSHLTGATNRAKFTVGLIRGLGSNLPDAAKCQFAAKVFEAMGESPPDPSYPLDVQVDQQTGTRLIPYPHAIILANHEIIKSLECDVFDMDDTAPLKTPLPNYFTSSLKPPLVITAHTRRSADSFRLWLKEPKAQQSFLLVGSEGCGKSQLLDYCLAASKRKVQVAVVQCAAQTRSSHILEKLTQYCTTVTSNSSSGASRMLRPKDGDRLVLLLRDLNLPKPDKWGSCEVVAFLEQMLTYKGYYDTTSLEFIGIEGIQVVATLTPSSTSGGMGRYPMSPRLTSLLRVASVTNPDREELNKIYHCLLQHISTETNKYAPGALTSKSKIMEGCGRLHILASTMVHAWSQMEATFRASKFPHCSFSLRDLTRWVIGMLRYDFSSDSQSSDLWISFGYEARRIFRDRLPGEEHRLQFDRVFSSLLRGASDNDIDYSDWNASQSKIINQAALAAKFATGDPVESKSDDETEVSPTQKGQHWFVTWSSTDSQPSKADLPSRGKMLSLYSYQQLHNMVSSGLKQLAKESYAKASGLVVHPDFLDLVTRMDRVLSRPYGNLLLAGRCGIGRRSALRIVAHFHQLPVFTLRVGHNYTKRSFTNDLKSACQSAGVEGVPTILLVEDYQLVQDIILETINSLLACGEAPGLISAEDIESMSLASGEGTSLRESASEAGYAGNLMSFFAERVHENLHIVILLDIDDTERLISHLHANPSLYKYCEVSWLDKWSSGSQLLLPPLLVPSLPDSIQNNVFSRACLAIHNTTPHPRLASPRRFIVLCTTYKELEKQHRAQLESQVSRLRMGLAKLDYAKQHVNTLKLSAAKQESQLKVQQEEADKALTEISSAMQGAGKQRAEMQELQKRSAVEAVNLERRKETIDAELAEIGPILKEAQSAVGSIRPEALSEIRALRAPPDVIRDILEGVLLLMGVRDTSWVCMRSFLARRGVQEEIRNFDARRLTPELRHSVEVLLKKCADSFNPKTEFLESLFMYDASPDHFYYSPLIISRFWLSHHFECFPASQFARRASVAAAPLAAWVQANVQFAKVLEKIAPLEKEQAALKRSLEGTQVAMKKLSDDLNTVDKRVAELRHTFESHTKAAADLQIELSKAKHTLSVAENLVTELEGEHVRWEKQVLSLTRQLETLPATAIISAGFITYLSACSEDEREATVSNWWQQIEELGLSIPAKQASSKAVPFDFKRFLVTEKEQLQWRSQGLPSDQLSVENAAVILQNPNFVTVLELAVRFGKALIIQEVDQIAPIIFPILKKDLIFQGPRATVKLGEKEVDYNESFRLFMTTRQPCISVGAVTPECASSLVTVVNFQATRVGLMGQLLEITLQHERAELETRRLELLKGEEDKKLELAQLEDRLLEDLVNAHGNILENTDLLESINKTKRSSVCVAQSLAEFERLQAELDNERKEFRQLAEGGSRVFFALGDLMKINNMYQFSLNSFLTLFRKALATPQDPSTPTSTRLAFLLRRVETLVVERVLRALFKADRLTFLVHLTRCLRPKEVTESEWKFFIHGPSSDCKIDTENLPLWIPADRKAAVSSLRADQSVLYSKLHFDKTELWSSWMKSEDAEEGKLPAAFDKLSSTDFQVLLTVQALRPTELYRAMKQFAKKTLDLPHLSPSSASLQRLFAAETSSCEPILIIISPGTDPSQELAEAADKHAYREVAMGQGQLENALVEITKAAKSGGWVCLKNLHLVTHWLPVLEKHINSVVQPHSKAEAQGADVDQWPHPDFRLWLTTEPHSNFPSTLLQSCLKVAYEAPPGLRNNMKRTYESWNAEYVAKGNSVTRSTALASLAWFHAVLQERRCFIPQGWTKFYEFTLVDIRAAADILNRLFPPTTSKTPASAPWSSIRGLLCNAIYGGRMDNPFDVKVLESFLNQIFCEDTLNQRQLGPLRLPSSVNIKDYVTAIDALSDVDKPRDLGLPANIGKTAQHIASANVLGQLRMLQRIVGSSNQNDRSLWLRELGPALALWKKLNHSGCLLPNKNGNLYEILMKLGERSLRDAKESPVLSFLHREMTSALSLIATVHHNLGSISKFLRGTCVLTQEMDAVIHSILRGETPTSWLKAWSTGPEDYSSFLRILIAKTQAMEKWLIRAESSTQFLSTEVNYNLADLFNPSVFLNVVRQQTARHLGVAIDQLQLVSNWPRAHRGLGSHLGNQALTISDLHLEGAVLENGKLDDCHAASPTVGALPDIQIAWKSVAMAEPFGLDETVELPVYFDFTRSSLVTQLRVPCLPGSQLKWMQNGTAILLKPF
ncbi:unnamed protein product [Mesocestoides corti]|uniref:Cytoplasmic dynein 2 heavy chain 1 n=4 Tax=Mesocestoides corti TaxID=53468 RepID=A0A3P6G7R1_MESCO|nr:unnamed protein product [Mesocestoides corti]